MKKEQLKFIRWKKLKAGDWSISFGVSQKCFKSLKDAAWEDPSITLADLKYQAETSKKPKTFDDCLVGAFMLKIIKRFVDEELNTTSKKTYDSRGIRFI